MKIAEKLFAGLGVQTHDLSIQYQGVERKVVFTHHAPCMVATDHWVRIDELVPVAIALFPGS